MHDTASQAGDTADMSSIAAGFGSVHSPGYTLYVGAVKAKVGHGGNCCGHGSPHQVHYDTQTLPDPRPDRPSFRPTRATLPLGPLSMTLGINVAEKSHVCRAARVADGRNIMINNSDIAVGTLPCSLSYYPADAGMPKGGNVSRVIARSNRHTECGKSGLTI
ncbi:beta-ketoacyl synthase domain-containing protein [Colletotrichum cuscutae]|uniref:Beta-ketoacyl synthase domain-containing protein n=1 Tax=Colletotrichum cuscutae TaxID=1209917 RepID=A0AAI9XWF0_9PEZI|nr:beta-ketoacyl synthase domain-containing protein [Colletotrichum cuscutae]